MASESVLFADLCRYEAMMKMSQLMKDRAHNMMIGITDRNGSDRFNQLASKLRLKSTFKQTLRFWKTSAKEMVKHERLADAAECYVNMSEVCFGYGCSEHWTDHSIQYLLKAARYYCDSNDKIRAVLTTKQALSRMELSSIKNNGHYVAKKNIEDIIRLYEECSGWYESIGNHHLKSLNQSITKYFININGDQYNFDQWLSAFANNTTALHIDHHNNNHNNSDDRSNDFESDASKQIDDKRLVWRDIHKLDPSMGQSVDSDSDLDSNDEDSEDLGPILERPSKVLLAANLAKLNKSPVFVVTREPTTNVLHIDASPPVERPPKRSSNGRNLTTEITRVAPSPQLTTDRLQHNNRPAKRTRRKKPSELSEENPQRRWSKLSQEEQANFIVDQNHPSDRLFCTLCKDSLKCYRKSIISDHIECNKHQDNLRRKQEQESLMRASRMLSKVYGESIYYIDGFDPFEPCAFDTQPLLPYQTQVSVPTANFDDSVAKFSTQTQAVDDSAKKSCPLPSSLPSTSYANNSNQLMADLTPLIPPTDASLFANTNDRQTGESQTERQTLNTPEVCSLGLNSPNYSEFDHFNSI